MYPNSVYDALWLTVSYTVQPIEYANAVTQHAKQTTTSSPFPGYNFENLASYLQRGTLPASPPLSDHRTLRTDDEPPAFSFVTKYRLEGTTAHRQDFDDPLKCLGPLHTKATPLVLFLKGIPSPQWLTKLGADYPVDPAFFNDHLDFEASYGRIDYFDFPPLPFSQPSILRLPYITLGQLEGVKRKVTQPDLDSLRECMSQRLDEHRANVHESFDKDRGLGQSLVRDFHLHDQINFALEQRVSISLCRAAGSWQRKHLRFVRVSFFPYSHGSSATIREGVLSLCLDSANLARHRSITDTSRTWSLGTIGKQGSAQRVPQLQLLSHHPSKTIRRTTAPTVQA